MHTASQNVHNATSRPMNLVLEPWANVYSVPPRRTWIVQLRSAQRGALELVREPEGITIYGWPGCTARIIEDGTVLESLDTPVPEVPRGMTVRRFVESVFGPHPAQRP